jgi:hypothetical protein
MSDSLPLGNSADVEVHRDESLVLSGIALAQLGKTGDSAEILRSLRAKYSAEQFPKLAIHLMILEGLIWYYDRRRPDSFDRVNRAYLLASAGLLDDLKAEAAVWLAHLAFNFEKYSSFRAGLSTALLGFDSLSDSLRSRVCLVIADSTRFLGQMETSNTWYKFARIFARRSGDRGVVAAIEYNRIVMGLSRARLEYFFSRTEASASINNWSAEFSSIKRLHEGMGVSSLSELLLLCQSYGLQLDGDFCGATKPLIDIRDAGAAGACGLSVQSLNLEIAWCRALCGEGSPSSGDQIPSLSEIEAWSLNEQFIGLMQLQDLMSRIDIEIDEIKFHTMLSRSLESCHRTLAELFEAVSDVELFLPPIRRLSGLAS